MMALRVCRNEIQIWEFLTSPGRDPEEGDCTVVRSKASFAALLLYFIFGPLNTELEAGPKWPKGLRANPRGSLQRVRW